jgi:hypothetical protein
MQLAPGLAEDVALEDARLGRDHLLVPRRPPLTCHDDRFSRRHAAAVFYLTISLIIAMIVPWMICRLPQ